MAHLLRPVMLSEKHARGLCPGPEALSRRPGPRRGPARTGVRGPGRALPPDQGVHPACTCTCTCTPAQAVSPTIPGGTAKGRMTAQGHLAPQWGPLPTLPSWEGRVSAPVRAAGFSARPARPPVRTPSTHLAAAVRGRPSRGASYTDGRRSVPGLGHSSRACRTRSPGLGSVSSRSPCPLGSVSPPSLAPFGALRRLSSLLRS